MGCIFSIVNVTVNQDFIDEAKKDTKLINGKALMDKNQFVNIFIAKLDQDEARLESVDGLNMNRDNGILININGTSFGKEYPTKH
jgi:hypothetical protein